MIEIAQDAGTWTIDDRCFNCSASQTLAPDLIVERDGRSVFLRQPESPADLASAWRATLLCPVGAVRPPKRLKPPSTRLFPQQLDDAVYRLGYNARSSWGAHSYTLTRPGGIVMIDAPRWTTKLERWIETAGGLAVILLTHKDDVADAERYARRFGARVFIHDDDAAGVSFSTDHIKGVARTSVLPGITAIPVPGHTRGSVMYLTDEGHLFTGDSLAWDHRHNAITAFEHACWYDWPTQLLSLAQLTGVVFEWILPGHGGTVHRPAAELQHALTRYLSDAAADGLLHQPKEEL